MYRFFRSGLVTALLVCIFSGCQEQQTVRSYDPAVLAKAREKFLLTQEPNGVEGVLDVQEEYTEPRDVVLVGQIGGVANPWSPGKAAFILADPITLSEFTASGSEHVCDDPGCKFCQRKKISKLKEGLAAVEFRAADGRVVPIDARQLFSLSDSQMVVVRGKIEVNDLGCLVVAADGLYVRR
jgi:hypothetical protein